MSDIPNKEFQRAVRNMLTKSRKQCMNKVKISTKNITKYTKGRMELKRTTIELKHSIEVFHSRQDRERKKSEKERAVKLIQSEEQKEKKRVKRKDSLRDLWGNTKWTNIHIIGVQEKRETSRKLT